MRGARDPNRAVLRPVLKCLQKPRVAYPVTFRIGTLPLTPDLICLQRRMEAAVPKEGNTGYGGDSRGLDWR